MKEDKHLYILWTNADVITSKHMVMMYATNAMLANGGIMLRVIIWGATAKLIAEMKTKVKHKDGHAGGS
jgi:hypothetical protein